MLSSNRFDRLVEGNDGTIWIRGYDQQIYAFSPTYARFLSLPISNYSTASVFPIGRRSVLIKTDGRQLIHASIDTLFTTVDTKDLMQGKGIHTNMVMKDSKQRVWVMTRNGLYTLDDNLRLQTVYKNGIYLNALEYGGRIYFGCGNGKCGGGMRPVNTGNN